MSRSKVGVKVMAQDVRGSALPSTTKSKKIHYQSKVFVCVSVIKVRTQTYISFVDFILFCFFFLFQLD